MVIKSEGKRIRQVQRYTRKSPTGKTVYVSDYWQRYNKPRGEWSQLVVDAPKDKSKTAWLKDSAGRFVGRANKAGKTTAKRVAMGRMDSTRNVRERGRYGRIKGRK